MRQAIGKNKVTQRNQLIYSILKDPQGINLNMDVTC